MLRQVNIDGVLYKIGDSRFEGDNLAYIQLPESITVGTPLTDLAPIQKALDSTDGSLLYAPSLNVFFAPTASSTPATTRIWASTTGDKGYQLKATLNESGILSSAVVVEAPAGDAHTILDYVNELVPAFGMGDVTKTTNVYTPITTPAAIAIGEKIINSSKPLCVNMGSATGSGESGLFYNVENYPLANEQLDDTTFIFGYVFGELSTRCVIRVFLAVDMATFAMTVTGANMYHPLIAKDDYLDLIHASDATTDLYLTTDRAKYIAKLLSTKVSLGNSGEVLLDHPFEQVKEEHITLPDGNSGYVDTFRTYGGLYLDGSTAYPPRDINVYETGGASREILGLSIRNLETSDHVVVAKEYMEVPTGHASHTCLEASISGTTLNITHKNESHISSVIHVPKSVLFTSPNAFELKFAPTSFMGMPATPYTPAAKIEISKDGLNWTQPTWDTTNGIRLKADTLNNEIGKYSVFIRSDNYINDINTATMSFKCSAFSEVSGSNIEVSGILESLWGCKAPTMFEAQSMFLGMSNLIGAKNLVFPTTVGMGGYMNMFTACSSLTSAPALPATTLGESCYSQMFIGCTSLTSAPVLPATTLVGSCYASMFMNCTSLTQAPALPATTLAEFCYESMFRGCTSLTVAPTLPATTLTKQCYAMMFQDCTSLAETPELPATEFDQTGTAFCYQAMFEGCTSLTKPVTFPTIHFSTVTHSDGNMFVGMFRGCTGIKWATSGTPYEIKTTDGSVISTAHTSEMFKDNTGDLPETSGTPKLNTTYYFESGGGTNHKFNFVWTDLMKNQFVESWDIGHMYAGTVNGWDFGEAAVLEIVPFLTDEWLASADESYVLHGHIQSTDGVIDIEDDIPFEQITASGRVQFKKEYDDGPLYIEIYPEDDGEIRHVFNIYQILW